MVCNVQHVAAPSLSRFIALLSHAVMMFNEHKREKIFLWNEKYA